MVIFSCIKTSELSNRLPRKLRQSLRGLVLLSMITAGTPAAVAASINASLSKAVLEVGEAGTLSVTIEGKAVDGKPVIPEVEDLVIEERGQSQRISFNNGSVSRTVTYQYIIGSNRPGVFDLPPIKSTIAGEQLQTESLQITVADTANNSAGIPSTANPQQGDAEKENSDVLEFGFLKFQLATNVRDYVYPGEIAAVRIRGFFPMGAQVSLSGPPRPDGTAFTLHNLTQQPDQSVEVLDGKRYQVVTWYGGLSATKVGNYPAGFSLGARVAVRDARARRQRGSPFGDPFFDSMFAPVVRKDVELKTADPPMLEVRELPKANRPLDFSGAIGRFKFGEVVIPAEMVTGEPARIRAAITGEGNFALLEPPLPTDPDEWKLYRADSEFISADAASFAGTIAV